MHERRFIRLTTEPDGGTLHIAVDSISSIEEINGERSNTKYAVVNGTTVRESVTEIFAMMRPPSATMLTR